MTKNKSETVKKMVVVLKYCRPNGKMKSIVPFIVVNDWENRKKHDLYNEFIEKVIEKSKRIRKGLFSIGVKIMDLDNGKTIEELIKVPVWGLFAQFDNTLLKKIVEDKYLDKFIDKAVKTIDKKAYRNDDYILNGENEPEIKHGELQSEISE